MTLTRQLAFWGVTACASVLLLVFALHSNRANTQRHFGAAVPPRPAAGRVLFQQKGCSACHGEDAGGTTSGPALRQRASLSSLSKLVAAVWNHAPRMWISMQQQGLEYPSLSYEETSQLIAYIYLSGADDKEGDVRRGAALFAGKDGCSRCHGEGARDARLASAALNSTALDWTQALWNHAIQMRLRLRQAGLEWPQFGPNDVRDLLAYIRHQNGNVPQQDSITSADPDHGWLVFQQKGCIRCHSLTSDDGGIGPYLGQQQKLPPTFSQFGAALLNHIPQMENAMAGQGLQWPSFGPNEVRDLTVFFYSLRYLEPSGSPQIGRTVFSWRGCARCHGTQAEGGSAPRLRGRGITFTASRLATDLWRHGRGMYARAQRDGQPWPELQESDVGNLLAFLNSPLGP
jgi:mono/diheme cytochrome c family protein